MKPTNHTRSNDIQPTRPTTDAATIDLSLFPGFYEFFAAYIEAALWSSTDPDTCEALDRNHSAADFDPDGFAELQAHALSFWARGLVWICNEPDATWSQAGHDFWLTQNRTGAGFFDGDWPTYGDRLTGLSRCYPELFLQVDEGVIYVNPA